MRLVKNKIELNGSGTVTLCPEEPEDMVRIPLALTEMFFFGGGV